MIHQRLFAAAFILLIQVNLSTGAIMFTCENKGNYTGNRTFRDNLLSSLSSLSTNIDDNGFYSASTGQGVDRANAIALCTGDLQLDACRECVQASAASLVVSCPNQKQAILWPADGSCMVRYSNATISRTLATDPGWYVLNFVNLTSPDRFEVDLRELLDDLKRRAAAGGSLRKVAGGNVTGPDFQTIFGLV